MGCSAEEYYDMITDWISHTSSHMHMIEKWLAVCGLTIADYLGHLRSGGTSDGCELWCFCLAMNWPINVIQEKTIWSTACDGVDFMHPIIFMTSYTDGFLCKLEDDCSENIPLGNSNVMRDKSTSSLKIGNTQKLRGCQKVEPVETPLDCDIDTESMQSSTDPGEHMEQEDGTRVPLPVSGHTKPHCCLVCGEMLGSGLALECHMKSLYPLQWPYTCSKCET